MIKFRAWVKPEILSNHMDGVIAEAKPDFIEKGCLVRRIDLKSDECFLEIIDIDDVILMQSTGLKDKNGVEIFVGDIVRHSEVATDISIVRFGEFGVPNIEEQSYQDCAVGFYYENASEFKDIEPLNMTVPLNSDYVKDVLVIGNIYANPELLNSGIE